MNISAPFIRRPVATTLLTAAIALAGVLAFFNLPVSSLPQIDFATITVATALPGASLRDVQDYAGHKDPRTTRRYDHSRDSLDRNAAYVVAAYLA